MGPTNKGKEMKYKNRSRKLTWKSDYTYVHLLNDDQRTLLDAFNRAMYGADVRPLESILGPLSTEFKKDIYSSHYAARTDALNQSQSSSYEHILSSLETIESNKNTKEN